MEQQEWQNVVFGDHVGTLAVQNGSLNFIAREGGALFSVPLIDFSFCRFLVKNETVGQVRLVVKPESRNPQTLDFAFSRLSHIQEFQDVRNYCLHNRKEIKKQASVAKVAVTGEERKRLPEPQYFQPGLRVVINRNIRVTVMTTVRDPFPELHANLIEGLQTTWEPVSRTPSKFFPRDIVDNCKTKEEKKDLVTLLYQVLQDSAGEWNGLMIVWPHNEAPHQSQESCQRIMEEHKLKVVLKKAVALQQERAQPLLLLTHSPVLAVELEKARLQQLLEEELEKQKKLRLQLESVDQQRQELLGLLGELHSCCVNVPSGITCTEVCRSIKKRRSGTRPKLKNGANRLDRF